MASVTCPSCGTENDELAVICRACSIDLASATAQNMIVPLPPPKETETKPEPPAEGEVIRCQFNGCGEPLGPDVQECPVCGAPRPRSGDPETKSPRSSGIWRLTIDDEEIRLSPGDVVSIGRALNATLSAKLQPFMSVSRDHIRLEVDESGQSMTLTDQGSSNGSRVGQMKIEAGESVTIDAEVELILGGQVSLRLGPA